MASSGSGSLAVRKSFFQNPRAAAGIDRAGRFVQTRSMPALSAILGFTGVALGALGAHGPLHDTIAANGTAAIWQTAVLYQLVHAVASLWASERRPAVAWLWAAGVLFFSGSLYALALTHIKWLGAITPIGGVLFLIGWAMLPRKQGSKQQG